MKIKNLIVGPYAVNCFLSYDLESKTGLIIDPGFEPDRVADAVEQIGFKPVAILLTHGHLDHIGGVEELREKYNIPLYAGRHELELLTDPSKNMSALQGPPIALKEPEFLLDDNEEISFGSISFKILFTPGHSPGSICFYNKEESILICGDVLFAGSIGRTDLLGGSFEQLMESINQKIMTLPDDVICMPGHGDRTTVGIERESNPFIKGEYFA